jgi:hypothetical protein
MGEGQFINRERERERLAKSSGVRIFGGAKKDDRRL